MFTEPQRMAYQSIRAPQELKEKIMAKKKPSGRLPMYLSTALAACLVLAIGIGFFFQGGEPGIKINGQQLDTSLVYYDLSPASEARSTPVLTVPVELELSGESVLSVSHGSLVQEGKSPVTQLTAEGSLSLIWEIRRTEEMPPCELTITNGNDVTTMTLTYENSQISITKKGE